MPGSGLSHYTLIKKNILKFFIAVRMPLCLEPKVLTSYDLTPKRDLKSRESHCSARGTASSKLCSTPHVSHAELFSCTGRRAGRAASVQRRPVTAATLSDPAEDTTSVSPHRPHRSEYLISFLRKFD